MDPNFLDEFRQFVYDERRAEGDSPEVAALAAQLAVTEIAGDGK